MLRSSGSEHAYSPSSNDNKARTAWRRLGASQWAALVGLTTLVATTTVHALTPREMKLPPDFDAQMEKLALAIMLMPCDHREPGHPDIRVADPRDRAQVAAD